MCNMLNVDAVGWKCWIRLSGPQEDQRELCKQGRTLTFYPGILHNESEEYGKNSIRYDKTYSVGLFISHKYVIVDNIPLKLKCTKLFIFHKFFPLLESLTS